MAWQDEVAAGYDEAWTAFKDNRVKPEEFLKRAVDSKNAWRSIGKRIAAVHYSTIQRNTETVPAPTG